MEVVPQLFYDLIGRLVPGMVLLLSFGIVYAGPTYALSSIEPLLSGRNLSFGFWTFLVLIMVSYVVSIVLSGLWDGVTELFHRFFTVVKALLNHSSTKGNNKEDDSEYPSHSLMYDIIRLKAPDVGARLVKLRAESRLPKVLIAGWIILAVVNLYLLIRNPSVERTLLEGVLILSILGAYSFMRHIESRYTTSLKNHWDILCRDIKPINQ